jgi:hypothetical protein
MASMQVAKVTIYAIVDQMEQVPSIRENKTSSQRKKRSSSSGPLEPKELPGQVERFTHADFNGVFLNGGFVNPRMKSKNRKQDKAMPEQNDGINPTEIARRLESGVPIAGCFRFMIRPPGQDLPSKTKKSISKAVGKAAERVKQEIEAIRQANVPMPRSVPPRRQLVPAVEPRASVASNERPTEAEDDPNELARKIIFAQTGNSTTADLYVPVLPLEVLKCSSKRRRTKDVSFNLVQRPSGSEMDFSESRSSCSSCFSENNTPIDSMGEGAALCEGEEQETTRAFHSPMSPSFDSSRHHHHRYDRQEDLEASRTAAEILQDITRTLDAPSTVHRHQRQQPTGQDSFPADESGDVPDIFPEYSEGFAPALLYPAETDAELAERSPIRIETLSRYHDLPLSPVTISHADNVLTEELFGGEEEAEAQLLFQHAEKYSQLVEMLQDVVAENSPSPQKSIPARDSEIVSSMFDMAQPVPTPADSSIHGGKKKKNKQKPTRGGVNYDGKAGQW